LYHFFDWHEKYHDSVFSCDHLSRHHFIVEKQSDQKACTLFQAAGGK